MGNIRIRIHNRSNFKQKTYNFQSIPKNKVSLLSSGGYYLSAVNGGGGELNFHSVERLDSELFDLIQVSETEFALRTANRHYV